MAIAAMAGSGAPIPNNSGAPIPGVGGGGVTNTLRDIRSSRPPAMMMDVPWVYLGLEDTTGPGEGAGFRDRSGLLGQPGDPKVAPLQALMNEFDSWGQKKHRDLAERLAWTGLLGTPNEGESFKEFVNSVPLLRVREAYQALMEDAATRFANGQRITPMQILDQLVDYSKKSAKKGGGIFGELNFSGTETVTSTSVDIFSAQDARGLVRATLRRELDRDPTEEEFEDFVAAIQAKQRNSPTHSTTTYTYEDGEMVDQSVTSRGGISEAGLTEFATQRARSQPGWAEWQAAGQLFPAALAALGSGVPGV